MVQPDNFSLYQPLVAGALWMGARGLKGSPRSFAARRPPGRAGDAVAQRRAARPRRARARLPSGTAGAARGAPRWRRAGHPVRRPLACVGLFVAGDGAVVAPPARGVRVRSPRRPPRARSCSSATSASGTASRRRRRSITCWAWASGRSSRPRIGGLVAAVMIFTTLIAGFVLAPFMVIGAGRAGARSTSVRSSLYAGLLFGFSALVSAVHVPGGTFIHSAVALAPHAYILALEGIAVGRRLDRRASARLGRRRRRPVFTGAAVALRRRGRAPRVAVRARGLGGQPGQVQRRRRGARRAGAAATDRVMSIDAVGDQVLDRPWRRGPRQRPDRDDRGRSPRLRHPLARPRPRGQRRGGRAGPRRHRPAGAGSGDADPDARGEPLRPARSTRSEAAP